MIRRLLLTLALLCWAAPAHAAFMFASGSFTLTNGTGNLDIIDSNCVNPRVVLAYWTRQTTNNAFTAGVSGGMGIAVDRATDQQVMVNYFVADGVTTTDTETETRDTTFIRIIANGTAGYNIDATITSFNSNGFSINRVVNDNTIAPIIKYVCLGGSDLTNAYVGTFTGPTSGTTGNVAFTGVGFQGNALIALGVQAGAVGANQDHEFYLGAAASASQRAGAVMYGDDANATPLNKSESYINSSAVFTMADGGTMSMAEEADFVTFGADGFTFNYLGTTTSARIFFGLVLQGTFQVHVGSQARLTSNTTQAITTGFQPVGVLLWGTYATANATETVQGHFIMGAGNTTRNDGIWVGDSAQATTTDANMYTSIANIYTQATNPSTVAAQAAISATSSTSYTLNWTTTDGNARRYNHIAFGNSATPPPSGGRRAPVMIQ